MITLVYPSTMQLDIVHDNPQDHEIVVLKYMVNNRIWI